MSVSKSDLIELFGKNNYRVLKDAADDRFATKASAENRQGRKIKPIPYSEIHRLCSLVESQPALSASEKLKLFIEISRDIPVYEMFAAMGEFVSVQISTSPGERSEELLDLLTRYVRELLEREDRTHDELGMALEVSYFANQTLGPELWRRLFAESLGQAAQRDLIACSGMLAASVKYPIFEKAIHDPNVSDVVWYNLARSTPNTFGSFVFQTLYPMLDSLLAMPIASKHHELRNHLFWASTLFKRFGDSAAFISEDGYVFLNREKAAEFIASLGALQGGVHSIRVFADATESNSTRSDEHISLRSKYVFRIRPTLWARIRAILAFKNLPDVPSWETWSERSVIESSKVILSGPKDSLFTIMTIDREMFDWIKQHRLLDRTGLV